MPSNALTIWSNDRIQKLEYMVDVHQRVGGSAQGRRFKTEQINHLFVVTLSGEFQAFCRELHDECSDYWVTLIAHANQRVVTRDLFVSGRILNHGNPNPSNLGSDFGRFGLKLWTEVTSQYASGQTWQDRLEVLIGWRNAVAHQDFSPGNRGGITSLTLRQVQEWRRTCNRLAKAFDKIMRDHLTTITGHAPW